MALDSILPAVLLWIVLTGCCHGDLVTFDRGLQDYVQSASDDFDWTRYKGRTPSWYTGPQRDHTENGYYMYIESTVQTTGDTAKLMSPPMVKPASPSCHMTFWYYMYGATVDTLEVRVNGTSTGTRILATITGNHGPIWLSYSVNVKSTLITSSNFNVFFVGTVGTTYLSDIAIDDISWSQDCFAVVIPSLQTMSYTSQPIASSTTKQALQPVGKVTDLPCRVTDFEEGWMGFTQDTGDTFDWSIGSGSNPAATSTGPSSDHTFGNSSGRYIFVDSTNPSSVGNYARLFSPAYKPAKTITTVLSFWYHMYGSGIGTLTVQLATERRLLSIFTKTGKFGNLWHKEKIGVPDISKEPWFRLVFIATVDQKNQGDVALDDFRFYDSCANCVGQQTFESGFDGWTQSVTDKFDWTRRSGETPSPGTGPTADHTSAKGYYLYIETSSPRVSGDTATITSPIFDRASSDLCKMTFWYHMYGSHIGSLVVSLATSANSKVVWKKSGHQYHQRNRWIYATVPLLPKTPVLPFRVSFTGVSGDYIAGDIAIDDISFSEQCCSGSKFLKSTCLNNDQLICTSNKTCSDGSCNTPSWCINQESCNQYLASPTTALQHNCYCKPGFTGTGCQTNIDDCFPKHCSNNSVCTDGVNNYTCYCNPGYTGRHCQANVDECSSHPCSPSHSCVDSFGSYYCKCVSGFAGQHCQTNIDDCISAPCFNFGTCFDDVNKYTCHCRAGFTGLHCQTNINECSSSPCIDNGSCVDGVNMYTCQCGAGFTGRHCETDIDDCAPNRCANNGTCFDGVDKYTCQCIRGFTGLYCEIDKDDCAAKRCLNHGNCTDGVNRYTCQCIAGFTGNHCQTNIDDCASRPCQNNGKCTDKVNRYLCDCRSGYGGRYCETSTSDEQTNSPSTKSQITMIIALSVALCTTALAVAVVLVVRKRRQRKQALQSQDISGTTTVNGSASFAHLGRTMQSGTKQTKPCDRTVPSRVDDDGQCNAAILFTNENQYEDLQGQPGPSARCSHSDIALTDEYEVPLSPNYKPSHQPNPDYASTIESSFSTVLSVDAHQQQTRVPNECSRSDSSSFIGRADLPNCSQTAPDEYQLEFTPTTISTPKAPGGDSDYSTLQHSNESHQSDGLPTERSHSQTSLDIYENVHPQDATTVSASHSTRQGTGNDSIYNTLQYSNIPHQSNDMPKARPHSQTSLPEYENVHIRSRSPSATQDPIDDSIYNTLQHDSVAQQSNAGACSSAGDEIYENPLSFPYGGNWQTSSSDNNAPPTGLEDI